MPSPNLAAYAATKAAIANLCASLAQMLGPKGIQVNSVALGPMSAPAHPGYHAAGKVEGFGGDVPLGRAGPPAELGAASGPAYDLLPGWVGIALALTFP